MIKVALTVVTLLTLAVPARADTFGYADRGKVLSKSTEFQREASKLSSSKDAKDAEMKTANDNVQRLQSSKAKQEQIAAAQASAVSVHDRLQKELSDEEDKFNNLMRDHLAKVCDRLAAEKHLAGVLPWVPLTSTKYDLTDEIIKRWNATDSEALAAENARLKTENDVLKAKADAKGTPPVAGKEPAKK